MPPGISIIICAAAYGGKETIMLLSTTTDVISLKYGYEKSIEMLAKAGYDAYDFSQFNKPLGEDDPLFGENFREYTQSLRALADSLGIVCNQSHAPFPSSVGDNEKDEAIFKGIVRSMEIAAILGAKCIIVHPKQHLTYRTNADALKRINLEFYRSLIPYAEKFGINVAVENMWQRNPIGGHIVDSTCSRAEEFCEYIDMLDHPRIVACLDLGHVALVGEDHELIIKALGAKRLRALHVHDVDGNVDLHTLPFTSKMDYAKITKALHDIGYGGDLTFEADGFFARFPVDMYQDVACFMQKTGRKLIEMIGQG